MLAWEDEADECSTGAAQTMLDKRRKVTGIITRKRRNDSIYVSPFLSYVLIALYQSNETIARKKQDINSPARFHRAFCISDRIHPT